MNAGIESTFANHSLIKQLLEPFRLLSRHTPLGLSWVVQPLSSRSVGVNVRPVVPRHLPEHITSVLWMQGHYEHYTRFQTRIMLYSTQSDSIP